MRRRVRVVDAETSGLTEEMELLELGSVDVTWDGERWEPQTQARTFFRNLKPIPPQARAVHHISASDLFEYQTWAEGGALWWRYLEELASYFPPAPLLAVAAHNVAFERPWIEPLNPGLPFVCTYKCALHAFPTAPSHGNQALRYWLEDEGRWPARFKRAEAEPSHRALPDAYVTAHLLMVLLQDHTLEQLIAWTEAPRLIERVPFGKDKGKLWSEVDLGLLTWTVGPDKDFDEDIKHAARQEIARRMAERDNAEAQKRLL